MPTPASPVLDESRYGAAARSRIPSGKLLAVGIIVLMAIAAVVIIQGMGRATQATIAPYAVGYEIVDDSTAVLKVDVRRDDPSMEGVCIVRALDYDMNEVGRREFYVPPGEASIAMFEVEIPTRARATAADTYGCGEQVPSYLIKRAPAPVS